MTAQEQDPAKLLEAAQIASGMLLRNGVEDPRITSREALLMGAVSHLLVDQTSFHPSEAAALLGVYPGRVVQPLRRFKNDYGILNSHRTVLSSEESKSTRGPRIHYTATPFGSGIFKVFQTFEVFTTEEQQQAELADLLN